MKNLKMIGRIVFSAPFLVFGVLHLMNPKGFGVLVPEMYTNMAPATFWVIITGIIFILTSLALLAKRWMKWAGIILAIQLLIFVLTIWLPQLGGDDPTAMGSLLKDLALAGGALLLAGGSCVCGCGGANCAHCKNCKDCQVDPDKGLDDSTM